VLEDLIAEGLSVREIGDRLGRTHASVRYWMTKHGLVTPRGALWRASRAARDDVASTHRGVCPRHGEVRFVRRDTGFRCDQCRSEAVTKRRRDLKRRLVEEAGGRCVACGYERCIAALHFHHLDPATKSFAVAGAGITRSLAVSRAEAAKCILLCANCHAEVEVGAREVPFTGA
jgi:hypothetical protein